MAVSNPLTVTPREQQRIAAIVAVDAQEINQTPVELLKSNETAILFAESSDLLAVQETLLGGYYQVVPVQNAGKIAAQFTGNLSVSADATENQQNAAMLFISFLLSNSSQNQLCLQGNSAIPLNRETFDAYMGTNRELAFLSDREDDFCFFENDNPALEPFAQQLFETLMTKEVTEQKVEAFLKAYKP
jgi:ABC-type glycerol-3-phosphate transport system substrate-binding protein